MPVCSKSSVPGAGGRGADGAGTAARGGGGDDGGGVARAVAHPLTTTARKSHKRGDCITNRLLQVPCWTGPSLATGFGAGTRLVTRLHIA